MIIPVRIIEVFVLTRFGLARVYCTCISKFPIAHAEQYKKVDQGKEGMTW